MNHNPPQPYSVHGLISTAAANNFAPTNLTESYGYQASLFQAADFIPPFVPIASYGNQNPATMSPLSVGMVPETRGIFGPLFGIPGHCPKARSVGPLYDLPPLLQNLAYGSPQRLCPPVQDIPYRH
jgi:hypothetical protein